MEPASRCPTACPVGVERCVRHQAGADRAIAWVHGVSLDAVDPAEVVVQALGPRQQPVAAIDRAVGGEESRRRPHRSTARSSSCGRGCPARAGCKGPCWNTLPHPPRTPAGRASRTSTALPGRWSPGHRRGSGFLGPIGVVRRHCRRRIDSRRFLAILAPELFVGDQSPLVGMSSVPTQALVTRSNSSYTVRVIVPPGATCRIFGQRRRSRKASGQNSCPWRRSRWPVLPGSDPLPRLGR